LGRFHRLPQVQSIKIPSQSLPAPDAISRATSVVRGGFPVHYPQVHLPKELLSDADRAEIEGVRRERIRKSKHTRTGTWKGPGETRRIHL